MKEKKWPTVVLLLLLLAAVAATGLRRMLREPVAPTTSSNCESRPIMHLLEKLRAPSASELGRKRKCDANSASPKGKKHSTQNLRKFDPKSVQLSVFFYEEFLRIIGH